MIGKIRIFRADGYDPAKGRGNRDAALDRLAAKRASGGRAAAAKRRAKGKQNSGFGRKA